MPLTTPQNLITIALKAAGILGVGQTALAEDNSDMFDLLNAMLGSWSTDRWLVYQELDIFCTTTGAQSYSIGPGQTLNTTERVDRLEAAYFRQYVSAVPGQNYADYDLKILQSHEDYAAITLKGLTSWPYAIFLDSGNPTGLVYPYPIPLQNGQAFGSDFFVNEALFTRPVPLHHWQIIVCG